MPPRIPATAILLFALAGPLLAQDLTIRRVGPGDDLREAALRLRPGDTLLLANGTYRDPVFLDGLKGTEAAPITIRGESRDGVVLDGGVREFPARPGDGVWKEEWDYRGRFDLWSSSHVVVRSLTVRNTRCLGLQVGDSDHVAIEDVFVDGTAHAGMRVQGTHLRIVGNEIARANQGVEEDGEVLYLEEGISVVGQSRHFEIAANRVHDSFKEGIVVKEQGSDGEVHDNVIERLGDVGIYLDECFRIRVDRNRIRSVGYLLVDGRERPVREHPVLSRLEEFGDAPHGVGIMLAVGDLGDLARGELADVEITRNEVWHSGAAGLMFWDEWKASGREGGSIHGIRILNNVFDDQVWAGLAIDDARDVEVSNNVVARCQESIVGNAVARTAVSHNLFHEAAPVGENAIEGDPRFADPERGDFRLGAGSPAVDRGREVGLPARGRPDIGARERGLDE